MIRGDVCYFSYPEPDKRRPVVVLTRTDAIEFLNDVTSAPVTTKLPFGWMRATDFAKLVR